MRNLEIWKSLKVSLRTKIFSLKILQQEVVLMVPLQDSEQGFEQNFEQGAQQGFGQNLEQGAQQGFGYVMVLSEEEEVLVSWNEFLHLLELVEQDKTETEYQLVRESKARSGNGIADLELLQSQVRLLLQRICLCWDHSTTGIARCVLGI
jgi:hypothetical protein